MPDFLAILGRQPELSAAELVAIAPSLHATVHPAGEQAALVQAPEGFVQAFERFGGIVKLGSLISRVSSIDDLLDDAFLGALHRHLPPKGKTVFGVSVYGPPALQRDGQALTKRIKTFLAENGRPARFVLGERGVLSSVVVAKERMPERGVELLIVHDGRELLVAKTVAVQAFEEFSRRDYGRPGRNAAVGMLPPKLARIMINLSGADENSALLDPFCGSGTVLHEALLLGLRGIAGTDIEEQAVRDASTNVSWVARQEKLGVGRVQIRRADVVDLGKLFRPSSVDVIVTEPTLGPPQRPAKPGQRDSEDIEAIRHKLTDLYTKAFRVFRQLLRPGGRVVFLLPVFYQGPTPRFFGDLAAIVGAEFNLMPALPADFLDVFSARLSFRRTIVYHRPGQRVGREVLVAERTMH